MWCRLVIEGNAVYEIDEDCMKEKEGQGKRRGPRGDERPARTGRPGGMGEMD